MNFIHFIDKSKLDSAIKNGIKVNECYRGKGILIYPDKEIRFKTHSTEPELLEDEAHSNKLSNKEKWERIGALALRDRGRTVQAIKFQLSDSHWPMKVFIDLQSPIVKKFAELLNENKAIQYVSDHSLFEVINNIQSEQYVLEGVFAVKSQIDLTTLVNIFIEADGGIWGAHSFDCMIESDIKPNLIL